MKALIEHIKIKKKTYQIVAGVTIICLTIGWVGFRKNSYAITVDGNVVAVVKEKEEAKVALETVVKNIKEEKGVDIAIREEVAVAHVNSKPNEIVVGEQVISQLSDVVSYDIEAYEILIDGEAFATVESEAIAEEVLTEIAKQYLPGESEIVLDIKRLKTEHEESEQTPSTTQTTESTSPEEVEVVEVEEAKPLTDTQTAIKVGEIAIDEAAKKEAEEKEGKKVKRDIKNFDFNEEVTVKSTYVSEDEVLTEEQAIETLMGTKQETKEYEMKEGDNIWDIAVKHGTTMEHILEINPQITDERKMQIGDQIKLEVPEPILSVSTVEQAIFKELIPAEIEYVEFSDLYKDETKIYQEGHDGMKEITVNVMKINGQEVAREGIAEKILKEPKTTVMAYGTKEKPKPQPTKPSGTSSNNSSTSKPSVKPSQSGQFMHPLNGKGSVSSPYGSRWGSFHRGIDIAAPAGTPIYASASGTVVYSEYNNGGYGKMVIIDHGNGYRTYYAHNSSLYVSVGQKVSKGQNIAAVGSTGDSTGNHVHFEIRKNGSPINPNGYIY